MRGILAGGGPTGPWRGIAIVVVVAFFVWAFGGALSDARTSSALRVEVSGTPQRVQGSDGREHLEYDLMITNAFTGEATLRSLQVRGDRRGVLSLSGGALGAVTLRVGTSAPTRGRIEPGSTVVIQVDVVLPRSAGRRVPRLLTNRIRYAIPANAPVRAVIGTTTVEVPAVRVDRRAPVVIASPLRGSGWLNANGCCGDPTSPHRNTVLATSDGRYITPEMFAIDWIRVVNGRLHTGDGTKNIDWPTYGAPLYAVANGTVVSAVDGRPDIPPSSPNPGLRTPRDFGGRRVFEDRTAPLRLLCAHKNRIGTGAARTARPGRATDRTGWKQRQHDRAASAFRYPAPTGLPVPKRAFRDRPLHPGGHRRSGDHTYARQHYRPAAPRAPVTPAHHIGDHALAAPAWSDLDCRSGLIP
jgi:hypothetical protein